MMANAAFLAALVVFLIVGWLAGELRFLAPFKGVLFHTHGMFIVGVSVLADSSINLAVRPWTKVADYGPACSELYQAIVERFRERNISIPFPQHEVRMLDH